MGLEWQDLQKGLLVPILPLAGGAAHVLSGSCSQPLLPPSSTSTAQHQHQVLSSIQDPETSDSQCSRRISRRLESSWPPGQLVEGLVSGGCLYRAVCAPLDWSGAASSPLSSRSSTCHPVAKQPPRREQLAVHTEWEWPEWAGLRKTWGADGNHFTPARS